MLLDFDKLVKKYNLRIKGVIQIGAHYGEEHQLYRKNGIEKIVYFEPLSKNFEVLKERIGDDATLFKLALGNDTTFVDMYVETANNGQSSSILKPKLHTIQYPHIVFDQKETVKMTKLDEVDFDFTDYNLINIDVQGYELEVFKGSISVLNGVDFIITEVNRDEVYEGCTKINDLDNFLLRFNFHRVETTWDGQTWGDAFYVKR